MQPAKLERDSSSKVVAQRSMLEKLKLFNSKGSSKSTSSASNGAVVLVDRAETGSNTDPMEEDQGNVRPGANSTGSGTTPTTATSPKMALRGIAQRTFSRALISKKASVKSTEKEKEKEKGKRISVPERAELRWEEPKEEAADTGDGSTRRTSKISSLIPKGGKVAKKEVTTAAAAAAATSTSAHSGIPKPGAKAERPRSGRMGVARATQPENQRDSRYSSSTSSLASSEGKKESSTAPVAGGGSTTQSTASNTVSVQLPQNQQHHSHPNTATVAPFMYR